MAKRTGASPGLVTRKLGRGKTEREIAEEAELRKSESYAKAQERKERALADLRELELAQKRGQLVEVESQAQEWARVAQTIRDNVLSIPDRIARDIAVITDPRQVRDRIAKELRKALSSLSDEIRVANSGAA